MRYINLKTNEYYEIADFSILVKQENILVHVTHAFIKDSLPEFETLEFGIANRILSGTVQIDPNWKEKPEGIDLQNPATWGGFTWEQIPRVLPKTTDYNDVRVAVASGQSYELAIFNKLIAQKQISTTDFELDSNA